MNLKWKFIYLGRRPSPSPLLSPDVLADVDVVDLKLSNITNDNRNVLISANGKFLVAIVRHGKFFQRGVDKN